MVLAGVARVMVALGWGLSLGCAATTASLGLAPRFGPWAWAWSVAWAGTWPWIRSWVEPPGGSARLWRMRAILLSCLSSSSLLFLRALLAL